MVIWFCGAVPRGVRLSTEVYSYLSVHGKSIYLNHKLIFFCMQPLQGFTCSIINLLCFGAHSDIHWCGAFLLQRSQKYHVLWLIQFWKQFHSLLHYLILLNFRYENNPTRKYFSSICLLESGHLARLNLKNTWSSILEGVTSLLSGSSLNFVREHSAQFMTIYRFNICFSFPFFLLSTLLEFIQLRKKLRMQDKTYCVPQSCVTFCLRDKAQHSGE